MKFSLPIRPLLVAVAASFICSASLAQGQSPLFFKLGGNSAGTYTGFSEKIGFNTYTDLRFVTNGTERMTLTKEGNLGLGLLTPQERLEIEGNLRASGCIKAKCLEIDGDARIRGTFRVGNGTFVMQENTVGDADKLMSTNSKIALGGYDGANFTNNIKVGIGTTNPRAALDIAGWLSLGSGYESAYGPASGAPSGSSGIAFPSTSNDFLRITSWHDGNDNSQLLFYTGDGAGDGVIFRNFREDLPSSDPNKEKDYLQINRHNMWYDGRIGIGTTAPKAALDINGWLSLGGGHESNYGPASGASSGSGGIYFPSSGDDFLKIYSQVNGIYSSIVFHHGDDQDDGIVFRSTASETNFDVVDYLLIKKGVMNLCGTLTAREIVVEENGWCDFVFNKDYMLPSLFERKEFIKQYGHLPYMQSEKEVTENGANVGKAITGLLQNTEEHALYLIQISETLEQLKRENELLKNEIKKLKKSNDN